MREHMEFIKLAEGVGYNRFNPYWFENYELCPETWLLEMTLLQKWLRETHYIRLWVEYSFIDSSTMEYTYKIILFPEELSNNKRLTDQWKIIDSFQPYGGTYSGGWKTYEETLENALKKALKLIKQSKT